MTVLVSHGAVTEITIDVPRTRNALSTAVLGEISSGIRAASTQASTRLIVLSGAGGSFSSGADLKEGAPAVASIAAVTDLYEAIGTAPLPVIARVEGHCLGLAVGVVAACDLAVAAEDTRFALPEPRMGQAPTLAAATIVERLRRGDLNRVLLTGMDFDGRHAQEIGLVDESVPGRQVEAIMQQWATQIMAGAPGAVAICKRLANDMPRLDRRGAFDLASHLTFERSASSEAAEAVSAAAEHRAPSWTAGQAPEGRSATEQPRGDHNG